MDILIAIIIGIVEGLTEFLPVSSTGHMILTEQFLDYKAAGLSSATMDSFLIVIQLGAILAIALVYRQRITRLFGLFRAGGGSAATGRPAGKRLTLVHVLIAIVPAMGLAFVLRDVIKDNFSPWPVFIGLIVGGIYMIIAEKKQPKVTADDMDDLTYRQALIIGISQCLSLWPGFSRSGSTIAGGMLGGASYKAAADFSFLIAIPIMCAASGYEILKGLDSFSKDDFVFFAVGFVVAFVVAWLVVVGFLKLLQKITLTHFAIYRFALAALVWAVLLR